MVYDSYVEVDINQGSNINKDSKNIMDNIMLK